MFRRPHDPFPVPVRGIHIFDELELKRAETFGRGQVYPVPDLVLQSVEFHGRMVGEIGAGNGIAAYLVFVLVDKTVHRVCRQVHVPAYPYNGITPAVLVQQGGDGLPVPDVAEHLLPGYETPVLNQCGIFSHDFIFYSKVVLLYYNRKLFKKHIYRYHIKCAGFNPVSHFF